MVRSLARVWAKERELLLPTLPDPVNEPLEKSEELILVPLIAQYRVVPASTLVVETEVVSVLPSLMEVLEGLMV